MALYTYLAMTAAEMAHCGTLPNKIGYMACHFSPYGTALSNLPQELPEGSLLILNDRTPIMGHDPKLINRQLEDCIKNFSCHGLLLDFQRADTGELKELSSILSQSLPCPVGVSESCGKDLPCPVFLPPCPLDTRLADHLRPWAGREIWLEVGTEETMLVLTEKGCTASQITEHSDMQFPHKEDTLHIHYQITEHHDRICFHLKRIKEDLQALIQEAEELGVSLCTGLYQQLKDDLQ